MQEVVITIENGTPVIHVKCVKGKTCKDLTEDLAMALGDVKESKPTSEFYEQAKQTIKANR